jgi:hypothetical protein
MTTERFTAKDRPTGDRMNELSDMFKTFDLRDRAHMLNLLTMGEAVTIWTGSLGKYQLTFEIEETYLNGCCVEMRSTSANYDDLSDIPFIKSALDEYLQENGVSGECFAVLSGDMIVGVFTSQLRAFNAAIRYAEKHGDYVETPITKDDFQDFSHNAKGEAVEWQLTKKDLCLDVRVEKHKTNFLQG